MTPEEIIEAYNVVTNDVSNQVAQDAAKIGNSQASLGTMAERVARPTGTTSGLANYTYNRTLRPTVDSLTASLTTSGKGQALDKYLLDKLLAAKQNYERAKNVYTVATTQSPNSPQVYTEPPMTDYYGDKNSINTPAGTITGTARNGNGVYDVIVADGKGGALRYSYFAKTPEEAKRKYYQGHPTPSGSAGNGFSGGGTSGGGVVVGGGGR